MATLTDVYANFAIVTVTESAANTLTFQKLDAGINLFSKVGWLISRIEWYIGGSLGQFNGTGDQLTVGLTQSNTIASVVPTEPGVLARLKIQRIDLGAAASGNFFLDPILQDFTSLPGGGLIVLPNPIYIGAQGSGLAAATTVTGRIWYNNVTLSDADYFELLQLRSVIQS